MEDKQELQALQAILAVARTARIEIDEEEGNAQIVFSYDNGDEVKWVTKEQLVRRLKSEIKELISEG